MNQQRLQKVLDNMKQAGLHQLLVTETEPVYYLTGIWVSPMERMMALYIREDGKVTFFGNKLFAIAPQEGLEMVEHTDSDDPVAQLAAAVLPGELGIDETWPSRFLIGLMSHRPDVKPVLGSEPVAQATMYKDEEERKLMRAASRIDDACIDMAIHAIREGITEKELSSKVEHFFQEKGCDHLGFSIVAMGANGADPHHGTDGTVLKEGDSIVMDIGAPFNHYWCDMTRTVFYKSASEEQRTVYETVRRANEAAIAVVKPGVAFKEIDLAARKVIEDAGYGEYFGHGYGHSLGILIHEAPNANTRNEEPMPENAVVSAEPGIYLPGKFGVRIEDVTVLTKDGCEILTKSPKNLIIL